MRAAIVGGGLAGLTAANALALGGASVTLHEMAPTLGGRAASDGVAATLLNRGPHALYLAGVGLPILKGLGVRPVGASPDLDRFDVVIDGEIGNAPTTAWSLARADYLSWGEKARLANFMGALFRLSPNEWDDRPASDLKDRYARTTTAGKVFEMMTMISTFGRTSRLSAGTALRQIRAAFAGVLYLDGGWQSLVDQLAALGRDRGVRFELNSRVRRVADLDADVVVLATSPDAVEAMSSIRFGTRRPTRMASLDLVMPTTPVAPRPTFDADRGIFLSFHPGDVVHCARYLDPFAEVDAEQARTEVEAVLDVAQPGWREHATYTRFLPKIRVNEWFPDAATGGQSGRPAVQVDERTFLAGDWVGPDGLLADAAIHSAATAARLALAGWTQAAA